MRKSQLTAIGFVMFLGLAGCGGGGGGGGDPAVQPSACTLLDGTVITTTESGCASYMGTFHPGQSEGEVTPTVPTKSTVASFAQSVELALRENFDVYLKTVGILGREFWNLNGIDPEYTGALMGKDGAQLPVDSPLLTVPFLKSYRTIQLCAILMRAANAASDLTATEVRAVEGFARTLQAYSLLLVLNRQFTQGILPVTSLEFPQPGNFLGYTASLTHIADVLDAGANDLTNGGASFVFSLTPGFANFSTPATFRQFNRALSARVRMYQGDKPGSISGIAGSFFNINGSMQTGPGLFYDTAVPNPMYVAPGTDLYTAHEDYLGDSLAGDLRVPSRTSPYLSAVSHDGLTGSTQVDIYPTPFTVLPLIRNEELILLYAEAQIGSSVNESLAAINRVRNANGLGNYLGASDDASMLNEVLRQRRYSLFGEGHRWVDLRRTGKFGQINIDRPGDVAHQQLPRPGAATLNQIPLR